MKGVRIFRAVFDHEYLCPTLAVLSNEFVLMHRSLMAQWLDIRYQGLKLMKNNDRIGTNESH